MAALKTLSISFFFKQFDPFNVHDNCNNGFVTVHNIYYCATEQTKNYCLLLSATAQERINTTIL